jgi:hypothetical protein
MSRALSGFTLLGLLFVSGLAGCLDTSTKGPQTPTPEPTPPRIPQFVPAVLISAERAHRETSLAINPKDPNNMIACTPSGVPNTGYGSSYFYHTIDNGTTWTELVVEGPMDPRKATFEGGDCDVTIGPDGTYYTADTWLGSISLGSSRDQGKTWDVGNPAAGSAPVADRPWLVPGPNGTIHLTYQDIQFGMPSLIWYMRSADYGRTFTPAVPLATATQDGAYTWTGNFVVSPSGQDLYSVYTRRQSMTTGSLESGGPQDAYVAASHDSGLTWTSRLVAKRDSPISFLYPSIAMDTSGILHVVFAQKANGSHPVFYTYSKDKALTWSKPVAVGEPVWAYAPWVDARTPGAAVVQWYGSPIDVEKRTANHTWFNYWAQIRGADTDQLNITWGPTSDEPFSDFQPANPGSTPEFNQVRLDPWGNMRIGASHWVTENGQARRWQITYQTQIAGPVH